MSRKRNVELLEQVMQHIEDHPEQHDQQVWINDCGTAACFAGWTCLLSGYKRSAGFLTLVEGPLGYAITPSEVARNLLGLTDAEDRTLFDAANTRDMLRLMVKDLVNGDDLRDRRQYESEADR